jgi:multiple sugar transport system ATP-binding protein
VFRERVTAGPGETITSAPDPALVHLFDSETGKRLV